MLSLLPVLSGDRNILST